MIFFTFRENNVNFIVKYLVGQNNVEQMWWKVIKDIFSEESGNIKTLYIKK